jgi:protein SCO1/2
MVGAARLTLAASPDPHATHRAAMQSNKAAVRTVKTFSTPTVVGFDQFGHAVDVNALLENDSPVIFNFIFTSCQTICPILSATFSQAQSALQNLPNQPLLVSFSIDPEFDTPDRLRDYASRFHAGDEWTFVTGKSDAMLTVQKSFDAYRGDKLNHVALTYMRMDSSQPWVKYEGFLSSAGLIAAFTSLSASTIDSRLSDASAR